MQKVKNCCRQAAEYVNGLCGFSAHVLAFFAEIACVLLLLALILGEFGGGTHSAALIDEAAKACAQSGMGLFAGGIALALISDVIAKYDLKSDE
ncbi:MAG: hypothetical protein LBQ48_07255 [Oscillospiraceae bacterium]|jgi:hypothetical protein|nr:hypothetical protein [Oscillospiraceae bacterium]